MRLPTGNPLMISASLVLIALTVGWLAGSVAWMLVLAAGVWIAIVHREHQRLRVFSLRPIRRPLLELDDLQVSSVRLFDALRRSRVRTGRALATLQRLRAVTEALPDAVVVLGASGEIEMFNQAARDQLQVRSEDVGIPLASIVRNPALVALLKGAVEDDQLEFEAPNEPGRYLEARRFPVASGRTLVIVRDTTQLNRLLSMRQDFVANVSHELRSPLTVVAGYLEELGDPTLDRETVDTLIAKLKSPTERMQALVRDLLMLTRLESDPYPDDLDEVEMGRVLRRALDDATPLLSADHELRAEIESVRRIRGSERELHSVCTNLIENAIRYSPMGGAVTVSWRDEGDRVRLAVADQGIGIAPEHLARITERFYRVDLAAARVRGGTGLGLAIVKHVLQRHGSKLEVSSELDGGSRFFCDFVPLLDSASESGGSDARLQETPAR